MNLTIEKVLRVLNHSGVAKDTTSTELARLTGLSRQTISKSRKQIEDYIKVAPAPSKEDIDYVDKKMIDTYVDIALKSGKKEQHFLQVMGAVAGYILRTNTSLINNVKSPKKIVRVGQEYSKLVTQVESIKGGKGTPVHSQNGAAKYLLTELNNSLLVATLFIRSQSYRSDAYSKSWKLTPKADTLNKQIVDATVNIIDKYNKQQARFTHLPLHIGDSRCTGKSVKLGTVDYTKVQQNFLIDVQDLKLLSVRSFLQIMSIANPFPPSFISVPLTNLANVDPTKGRTYNIFTRLSSSERKLLGYKNYDISGGLQIISFNILTHYPLYKYETLDDLHATYPLIFSYGVDPVAKRALRKKVAADLGVGLDEVKSLLTAYSNGSQKKTGNSEKLKQFFTESDQLRREVIATIADHEPDLLESAIEQSKHSFPEDTDWQSIEKEGSTKESQDKASVFFFIWTYFEKQIRDAMLSEVDDGIPLHDAIYSKQDIAYTDFQDAILEKTGFDVKIEG